MNSMSKKPSGLKPRTRLPANSPQSKSTARRQESLFASVDERLHANSDQSLRRPAAEVLSNAIPLYFIGRNRLGFWVARDCERHSGGLFLRKTAAVQFAKRKCGSRGYATTFLNDRFELDLVNSGNRLVGVLAVTAGVIARTSAAGKSIIKEFRRVLPAIALMGLIMTGIIVLKLVVLRPHF